MNEKDSFIRTRRFSLTILITLRTKLSCLVYNLMICSSILSWWLCIVCPLLYGTTSTNGIALHVIRMYCFYYYSVSDLDAISWDPIRWVVLEREEIYVAVMREYLYRIKLDRTCRCGRNSACGTSREDISKGNIREKISIGSAEGTKDWSVTDHQEASIWIGCLDVKEHCYID